MRWTEEEEAILREEIAQGAGWCRRACARLPNRTIGAIDSHAYYWRLNRHIKPWCSPREKSKLNPGQAAVARARRRSAMAH